MPYCKQFLVALRIKKKEAGGKMKSNICLVCSAKNWALKHSYRKKPNCQGQ